MISVVESTPPRCPDRSILSECDAVAIEFDERHGQVSRTIVVRD